MLKPTETSKKPKFLEKKLQKFQVFLEKIAKIWIFPQFSLKTLKYDKSLPYCEFTSRLYKVLNIKMKAHSGLKPTEFSEKVKKFGRKSQNFLVFGKKIAEIA